MAINTETKRRSVQAYTLGLMRPVADGTIGVGDRATVSWLFAADSYPDPTPPSSADTYQYSRNRRMNHRLVIRV